MDRTPERVKIPKLFMNVIFLIMLLFVPLSALLAYVIHAAPWLVFLTATLAIAPLAVWIQRATEQIADRTGPSVGGLLNVSFGNAAELIIALFVLTSGDAGVVKGQLTGSIIGNSLLGLGLATLIGTWGRDKLSFNRARAGELSTMLVLVLIGFLLPAIFDFTERDIARAPNALPLDERLSLAVSVVLILLYIGNLVYTLYTKRDIFAPGGPGESEQEGEAPWSTARAVIVLVAATAFTALEAEMVSDALNGTAKSLSVSTFFLGVVVLAVIGNIAEYVTAGYFASKGEMDMVVPITVGSTVQVALFVAPLLVLISHLIGHPMTLVFSNPIELIAIAGVAFVVNAISKDGEVNWFEGALLIGTYLLMAIAFFYVTTV